MFTLPLIQQISYINPLVLFAHVCHKEWLIFFDSAQNSNGKGRYSYICYSPFSTILSKNGNTFLNDQIIDLDPFTVLQQQLLLYPCPKLNALPPFQGGAAGFLSYDLNQRLENLSKPRVDDFDCQDLAIGLYDTVIAFDNLKLQAWIIATGYPEQGLSTRKQRAEHSIKMALASLAKVNSDKPSNQTNFISPEVIQSNFTPATYQDAVQKALDAIYAGEIFQVNLAQRFTTTLPDNYNLFSLYCQLRQINPNPFAGFLQLDDINILSASPERFLKLCENQVEACPIKGTRPRSRDELSDKKFAEELIQSSKDHAENIMIVDLLRNDMSKVCQAYTVQVPELCALRSYPHVYHLESIITGHLAPEKNAVDILKASFPGGSITGAPKIRAMEIIQILEPHARGPYCGCIGYVAFNGDMDMAITIRSFVVKDNKLSFHAGGAITADSSPEAEYQETLVKAKPLLRALSHGFNH